jgi:hypothetical protein
MIEKGKCCKGCIYCYEDESEDSFICLMGKDNIDSNLEECDEREEE